VILSEMLLRLRGAMLQLRYHFVRPHLISLSFLFVVKGCIVFQFFARPFN